MKLRPSEPGESGASESMDIGQSSLPGVYYSIDNFFDFGPQPEVPPQLVNYLEYVSTLKYTGESSDQLLDNEAEAQQSLGGSLPSPETAPLPSAPPPVSLPPTVVDENGVPEAATKGMPQDNQEDTQSPPVTIVDNPGGGVTVSIEGENNQPGGSVSVSSGGSVSVSLDGEAPTVLPDTNGDGHNIDELVGMAGRYLSDVNRFNNNYNRSLDRATTFLQRDQALTEKDRENKSQADKLREKAHTTREKIIENFKTEMEPIWIKDPRTGQMIRILTPRTS